MIPKPITIPQLHAMKARGEKITMLTCYDATFAKLLDGAGVEMLLVGDSLGMVIQGHTTTIPVTLDDIIYHTRAVARVTRRAHVVADLPFMSYQASASEAMHSAARCMKEGGATSVKIEGGEELVPTVAAMTAAGIPVMAHIGLRPQSIHQLGGYKVQGKSATAGQQLLKEAHLFAEAGAYGLLLEGIAMEVARDITAAVDIPTIGICSGSGCDGQVLVLYDLLGLDPAFSPKFVKRYSDLATTVQQAVSSYANEVKAGVFPTNEHAVHAEPTVIVGKSA